MRTRQVVDGTERRFDRGAWLTLAVVAACMLLIVPVVMAMQYPADGWASTRHTNEGGFVLNEPMSNASSALQPGDTVLAINGQPITADDFAPFPSDLREGQILRYTIRRTSGSDAAQTLDVDVTLVSVGAAGFLANFIARFQATPRDYIVSLLSFLIVSLAFFLRPGNLGARYLFLFFGFYFAVNWLGFASSDLYGYTYPPLLSFVLSAAPTSWGWYFFPTLMLIALAFPVVKAPLRRFPRLIPALAYGLPLAITVIATYRTIASRSFAGIDLLTPMFLTTFVLAVVVLFATAIHNWLTVREPVARLQLRWVTLGLVGGLGVMFVLMLVSLLLTGKLTNDFIFVLWFPLILPICLLIAITRYRLWDIDVVIRRTLQYAILTAILAVIYFGGIILAQQAFRLITGQNSDLAIVISTLLIAALFTPTRRRVQDVIDRRLYRRKYDAEQTLSRFNQSLRDVVDLPTLQASLLGVVQDTLQPAHSALWLQTPTDRVSSEVKP